MNTLATSMYRDAACAAAAAVVTLIVSLSFVQSTAVAPATRSEAQRLALQAEPSWFGQPQPAVLVD